MASEELMNPLTKVGQDWKGRLSLEAFKRLKEEGMDLFDLLYNRDYTIACVITGIGMKVDDEEMLTQLRSEAGQAAIKKLQKSSPTDYEIFVGAITLKDPTMQERPMLTRDDIIYEPKHAITILKKSMGAKR